MAVNTMTVNQAATVLNAVVAQATGQPLAQINPGDFVSVAQKAVLVGLDPIMNALTQVWSRTVFASRPYSAKFTGMEMTLDRFGNAMRKVSFISGDMQDDQRFLWPVGYDATGHSGNPLGNGQSVDMYKIRKQGVQQTNFYGKSVYQQSYTTFRDQLDVALSGPEEFARFSAGCLTERSNDRESYREAVARGLQANYIGALISENNASRVIHLLTEYNTKTGLELTAETVYQPENFRGFMAWCYARIKTLAQMMTERTNMYQTVVDGKTILRHTPPEMLRLAMSAQALNEMDAMVLADTYHDNYLKYVDREAVNFWQNPTAPTSINLTPVMTDADGTVKTGEVVNNSKVFAVMHDKDAMGYAITNNWSAKTPLNIDGGYWNDSIHTDFKSVTDMTEKGIVLLLD